jgi:hypothetical protein
MKNTAIIIVVLLITQVTTAQISSFGIIAGGGGTVVNVDKVVYPDILSDWNTWGMVVKGFAEYKIGQGNALGLEIGTNRLYYWEYQAAGYSWYNWRNEWTTNAVFYFSKTLGNQFYLQSGAGIHIFHNGTVIGILAGAGRSFLVTDNISVPIFLRVEPIFGTATPIAVNIGTGLRYNLVK